MANEIYNTTWWGNALDTARTAGTDPDFFGSQIKLLTSEQDNLVTNGGFYTDSNWTKGTGWSISDGKAVSNNLNTRSIYQNIGTPVVGQTYKVTYTILETNGGNFKFVYGGVNGAIRNSVGTYTENIVATSASDQNIYLDALNVMIGSIDNVSVQVVRCDLDQIEAKKCLADWIHRTALQDLNN